MKGNQQVSRAAVSLPVLGDAGAQRIDVARVLVIVRDEAQLRQPAPAAQLGTHLVVDGTGGGPAILREQRQHQDALCTGLAQSTERAAHVGSARRERCRACRPPPTWARACVARASW